MTIRTALAALAIALAAFAAGWGAHQPEPATHLQCPAPTEDSCIPEHDGDGRWHLKPVVP